MSKSFALLSLLCVATSCAFAKGPGANPFASIAKGLGLFSTSKNSISITGMRSTKDDPAQIDQQRFSSSVSLFKTDEESYTLGLGGGGFHMTDSATLSKTGTVVPRTFQRYDLSLGYNRNLSPGRFAGVRGSIGTASDKPFLDSGDTTYNLIGFYGYPGEDRSLWVLTAYASNNSPILNYIPFPGFFYMSKSDDFIYILGIPLASIAWTPKNKFKLSASAFGPSINLELSEMDDKPSQFFGGFTWGPQSFIRHDREKKDYRIYYTESKLLVGYRKSLSEDLNLEIQVGRAFDRKIQEGKKFGESQGGSAKLGASPFGALTINAAF